MSEEKLIKALLKDKTFSKAMSYALEKHKSQRRSEGTPYIFHPVRTFYLLSRLYPIDERTTPLLKASLLHDTLEDTSATPNEIDKLFGSDVLSIVKELTLPKGITHTQKGILLSEKICSFSDAALSIKLSDRFDNTSSLDILSMKKAKRYAKETQRILYNLSSSNRYLSNEQRTIFRGITENINNFDPPIYILKEQKPEKEK